MVKLSKIKLVIIFCLMMQLIVQNGLIIMASKEGKEIRGSIFINGEFISSSDWINFNNVKPYYGDNNVLLMPVRIILEQFGYKVKWVAEANKAIITKNKEKIVITKNSSIVTKNDNKKIVLTNNIIVNNGRLCASEEFFTSVFIDDCRIKTT